MATDQTSPGAARIVKTARSAQHLNLGEQKNVDVLWPTAFTDDNYSVSISVEYPLLATPTIGNAVVLAFKKITDHSGITCDVENGDAANPIDVVIHATAIHD
jgi:hypothetical protein